MTIEANSSMCSINTMFPSRNSQLLDPNSTNKLTVLTEFGVRGREDGPEEVLYNLTQLNLDNMTLGPESSEIDYYPDFSQIGIVHALFVILFLFEFLIGVVGNALVCVTIYRNKSMHSAVNYGIVNLGICDFLVGGFVLPTKLFELTAPADMNMMNDLWCTVIRFSESVVVFVNLFTLVAICIERYYVVVYPMQSRIHMTPYRIRKILLLVWIIPIIVAAPNLYPAIAVKHFLYSEYGEFTRLTCFDTFSDEFRKWYFIFLFIFMFLIPLLFIGTTCFSIARALMQKMPAQYTRRDARASILEHGRRKVAKMVLVIVLAFVICWSPYFLVSVITQLQEENFLHKKQFFFTMLSINLCCFTNSCINPFVYFSMSKRFRTGYMGILRSVSICSNRGRYSPDTNTSLTSSRRTRRQPNAHSTETHHRYITATTTTPSRRGSRCCSCSRTHFRSLSRRTCESAPGSEPTPTGSGSLLQQSTTSMPPYVTAHNIL